MFGVYRTICPFQIFPEYFSLVNKDFQFWKKKWLIWSHLLKFSLNLVVHLEQNEKVFNGKNILPTNILQLALLEADCLRKSNLREDRELDCAPVVTAAENRHLLVYSFLCDVNASLMPYTNISIHIINMHHLCLTQKNEKSSGTQVLNRFEEEFVSKKRLLRPWKKRTPPLLAFLARKYACIFIDLRIVIC